MPNIVFLPHSAKLITHTDLQGQTVSQLIASAARVSTQKEPLSADEAPAFVRKLMEWGHWSPFEFFDLTFRCITSRAVSHELVRHRLASYMQESQRYCGYSEELRIIVPEVMRAHPSLPRFEAACDLAYQSYLVLLEKGFKPEDARCVLPEATATTILVKMNLREFRHFLKLRTAPAAWSEMRTLAGCMVKAFTDRFPDEEYLVQGLGG